MVAAHGSKAQFSVEDASDQVRDLSSYLTSAGMPRSADTAEVSTLGMTSKAYIPGLKDGTIPIEGPLDATIDGYLDGLLGFETPRAFTYDPQGTGTGTPHYSGECFLTAYEPSTGVDDAGTFTGEFQITGDVTRGTNA